MHRPRQNRQQRLNRLQLIARVQLAYEQVREVMRAHDGSARARAAVAAARLRLGLLNRALALMALESTALAA